ncbi:MAG: nuclear transport factor 2 family protein [Gemmatimonadota bacterium]|nr:MAG: nuclear transport factor 2 family protein [Gemmatimonadota bacterium]
MAKRLSLIVAIGLMLPGTLAAQSSADSSAIVQTALDYIEGWYEGNAERMERALHPELAKRMVHADPGSGASVLNHMTAEQLVSGARAGYGTRTPEAERRRDVTILDIYENVASVKVVARDWIDYLHVVKFDSRWVIINVLWELTPEARQQMGAP